HASPDQTVPDRATPSLASPRHATNSIQYLIGSDTKSSKPTIASRSIISNTNTTASILQNVNDQLRIRNKLRIIFDAKRTRPFIETRAASNDARFLNNRAPCIDGVTRNRRTVAQLKLHQLFKNDDMTEARFHRRLFRFPRTGSA